MGTAAPAVEVHSFTLRAPRVAHALSSEWRDVGAPGRLALAGAALSLVVVAFLAGWIERSVRLHLLDVRTELLEATVRDMRADRVLPLGADRRVPPDLVALAVERRIIGGDLVGVAIRDAGGSVVYAQPDGAGAAEAVSSRLTHVERHADGLLHFVLPVRDDDRPVGSVEVLQQTQSSDALLARLRRNLWLTVSAAVGSLGIAMGALTAAHARAVRRRSRDVERLLRELARAEDRERRRIVGALHDDVGQPLYRLLYGLEGCRARVLGSGELAPELDRLTGLVRDVDRTLRGELHRLRRSALDGLDLRSALEALAEDCREESGLDVDVVVDATIEPPTLVRSVVVQVVREALVNVRKHANASAVSIVARARPTMVSVDVVDDGRGITGARGLGLTTAAERLQTIGGDLHVGPRGTDDTDGTLVRLWAPCRPGGVT